MILLAGCGGGSGGSTTAIPYTAPPAPQLGKTALDYFFVKTANYYTLYTDATAPFSPSYQLADNHYPIPIAYLQSPAPEGFDMATETEAAIRGWAQADPRVSAISGAPVGSERVSVVLTESISYQGLSNIIGLTKVNYDSNGPHFEVFVATKDPYDNTPMTNAELRKTLYHEMGHALGLGHSPDMHDVMYPSVTALQGQTFKTFLTYGDAMAIWSTLNNRHINWVQDRPTVTQADQAAGALSTDVKATARVTDTGGQVVCVYTRD